MKPETNWMKFINAEIIYKQRSERKIIKLVHLASAFQTNIASLFYGLRCPENLYLMWFKT